MPLNQPPTGYTPPPPRQRPKTLSGLPLRKQVVESGFELRHDNRARIPEVRAPMSVGGLEADTWLVLDDSAVLLIKAQLDTDLAPTEVRKHELTDQLLTLAHQNPVDAFIDDFLETLPPWDGEPRAATLLSSCFDLNDPATDQLGLHLLACVLHRTYEPGSTMDESMILTGPSGIGKTTFCRDLLPPSRGWYVSNLNMSATSDKDTPMVLRGSVIGELGELAGLRRAEVASLKQWLTVTVDQYRAPYDRLVTTAPRRFVLVGTSNGVIAEFPDDPALLRRFLYAPLAGGDGREVHQYLTANRDQVWAEALAMYREGYRGLSRAEMKAFLMPAAAVRGDELAEGLAALTDEELVEQSTTQILQKLEMGDERGRGRNRLRDLLRRRGLDEGWGRTATGKTARVWKKQQTPKEGL